MVGCYKVKWEPNAARFHPFQKSKTYRKMQGFLSRSYISLFISGTSHSVVQLAVSYAVGLLLRLKRAGPQSLFCPAPWAYQKGSLFSAAGTGHNDQVPRSQLMFRSMPYMKTCWYMTIPFLEVNSHKITEQTFGKKSPYSLQFPCHRNITRRAPQRFFDWSYLSYIFMKLIQKCRRSLIGIDDVKKLEGIINIEENWNIIEEEFEIRSWI